MQLKNLQELCSKIVELHFKRVPPLQNKFRKWHIRDGEQTKGRFGFALASLGDIDKDGFGDFAVGAPYSGPRAEGTVFVFRGSKAGARERPDQVRWV
jgi:integrin alpha 8